MAHGISNQFKNHFFQELTIDILIIITCITTFFFKDG